MLIEDENGQSEIAAAFLLIEETEQSLKTMMNTVYRDLLATDKIRRIGEFQKISK